MRRSTNWLNPSACLLVAALLGTGCHKGDTPDDNQEPDLASVHDLQPRLAPSTLAFSWNQGPVLGSYDFSNIHLQSDMAPVTGFNLKGGQDSGPEKRWLFSIKAQDTSLPTRDNDVFELTFGWSPVFQWQWFGQHPANYISFLLYKTDKMFWDAYCFATQAPTNSFSINQGTDRDGKYFDVVAGPVPMGKVGNGECNSSSPMTPSGMLTLTMRYRCNNIDSHFQGYPDWAEWVCQ